MRRPILARPARLRRGARLREDRGWTGPTKEESMAATTRTPQEVFQHHAETLMAGDIDGIVSDYADDAVFITPDGVLRGKDGIREAFTNLLGDVPDAEWQVPTQVFEGDVLLIEWTARAAETF